MIKKPLISEVISSIQKSIILERKTDQISLELSREVIRAFKENEPLFIEGVYVERGDEYASFDFTCKFEVDETMVEPFSISAYGDMEDVSIVITYNPDEFPKNMNDLVAEVKETIEHELEHVEQQNFQDMYVYNNIDDGDFFKYLTSPVEIPAYVRGLVKRARTKRISLDSAMEQWANENKNMFNDFKHEWPIVKNQWMNHAIKMVQKQKIKKFN